MKQAILSQNRNSLLAYAISRLSPDVFSHPVWIRFAEGQVVNFPDLAEDLLNAAKSVQEKDPGAACQILLICAVYQNRTAEPFQAIRTSQQAISLAEQSNLAREMIWALWGACAISIQQGNYEQAASSLVDLQAELSKQNEWILADFIDVLKRSLAQDGIVQNRREFTLLQSNPSDDPINLIWDWLNHWGSNLGSLWGSMSEQKLGGDATDEGSLHPRLSTALTTPVSDNLPPSPRSRKQELAFQKAVGQARQLAAPPADVIPVAVHMLGTFSLTVQDLKLKLPSSRGLSVLKYLLLHHKQKVGREVLMDVFWPDAEPEMARNNLNVTIHSLRKALHTVIFLPVIVFEDGAYGLESNLQVWLDVEEFEKCVKAGQRLEARGQLTSAVSEYETAISLYQGDFLEQNLYEEWTILDRERLRIAYLDTLDHLSQIYFSQERYAACITVCQLILAHDRCREDAHCLLMRCYSRQGQYHLARRQYQICVDALRIELEVDPSPEAKQLYKQIGQRERV